MVLKKQKSIVLISISYFIALYINMLGATAQAVEFPPRVTKSIIDNYVRRNIPDFPRSDYPYYEEPNACGQRFNDLAVKDSWFGVSLVSACNNHDRCYMTIGAKREECQENFRKDVIAACKKQATVPVVCIATLANSYQSITSFLGWAGDAWTSVQAKAHRYEATLEANKKNIIGNLSDPSGALVYISAAADGTVWGINADQDTFYWVNHTSSWLKPTPGKLTQVSVGSSKNIWGVNSQQQVFRWAGTGWEHINQGLLTQVSAAADGTVWGVNSQQQVFRWAGTGWEHINQGLLAQVSVGSSKNIWGVNSQQQVFRWAGTGWVYINQGLLTQVSAAADGTVWGINSAGQIFRWGGNGWINIPGNLSQVSAAANNSVWGVNSTGQIFHWIGGDWMRM